MREKLDMLLSKVQERKVREARIESKIAALLAISMSLDEELTVEMEEFTSMRESMAALRKKNKAFHKKVIDKLQKMCEKYPFYAKGLIVVPKTITRQRGNRLQTFIPRPSERRRLMLQQEGK